MCRIDQGTTSTRCILFDQRGQLVSVAQQEHQQYFPKPGWVEHDAVEIWRNVERLVPQALRHAGIGADQVAAIGIANQRETTVLWDRRTGVPIGHAIVWQDTRTDELVDRAGRGGPAPTTCSDRSGLPLATYFSGAADPLDARPHPGLRERAERGEVLFGTMETWLIWNLTGGADGGVHVTDVTNASRTLLMDLHTLDWDDELLEFFGIPRAMLPEIRLVRPRSYGATTRVVPGVTHRRGARRPAGGAVRPDLLHPGEAKCTYGTGSFLLLNTGHDPGALHARPAHHGRLPDRRRDRRSTRWKARSRSPARWCSGSATSSG